MLPWVLAFLCSSVWALGPNVIYGEDNRLDFDAVSDPVVRDWMDSTVALVEGSRLDERGDRVTLRTVGYGSSLALCPDEPFYHQPRLAMCSGALIAPDLVLTAGHCVPTADRCKQLRFVFGFKVEGGHAPTELPSEHVYACRELVKSVYEATGEDFAIVRLDRSVVDRTPMPLGGADGNEVTVGSRVSIAGYPSGIPVKYADGAVVRSVQDKFAVANLDAFKGNSGSPVFDPLTGAIQGVLVRGEKDFELRDGCYRSRVCAPGSCIGESFTRAERVRKALGD